MCCRFAPPPNPTILRLLRESLNFSMTLLASNPGLTQKTRSSLNSSAFLSLPKRHSLHLRIMLVYDSILYYQV